MLRHLLIGFVLWLDDKTYNWRSIEWLNKHVIDRKGWKRETDRLKSDRKQQEG